MSNSSFLRASLILAASCGSDTSAPAQTACQDDSFATGNAMPAPINLDFDQKDLVMCGQTEDRFSFTLKPKLLYTLTATFSQPEGALNLQLFRVNGNQQSSMASAQGTDGKTSLQFAFSGDEPAPYELLVHRLQPIGTTHAPASQNYHLSVTGGSPVQCTKHAECAQGQHCLSYQCVDAMVGDTCVNPILIDSLPFSAKGVQLSTFFDDWKFISNQCLGGLSSMTAGPDIFYRLSARKGESIKITLNIDFPGAALFVASQCTESPVADSVCLTGERVYSGAKVLEYIPTADAQLLIGVDLGDGASGRTFDLDVASQK